MSVSSVDRCRGVDGVVDAPPLQGLDINHGGLAVYSNIDDYLGPAAARFFGQGFRRVGHAIRDVVVRPAPVGGSVTALADVRYPMDWSVKDATDAPQPHLSTIDVLSIAVQVAEVYLVQAFTLTEQDRASAWLRSFSMRAGSTPQVDLLGTPVTGTARHTLPTSRGLGMAVTTFDVQVGSIRISLDVEHDVSGRSQTSGMWAQAEELLGPADQRYFAEGFRKRPQRISDVTVDVPGGVLTALVRAGEPGMADYGLGFAANYEPSLCMVDAVVALSQIAQILMYKTEEVERSQTGTLWMRRLAMHAETPYQPLANAFVASTRVVRRKTLEREGVNWRMYDLNGLFQGIEASASLAFTIPD